jgi:hypothetical protein
MSSQKTLQLQIDSAHCRAICDEIGERLGYVLGKETGEIPQRLRLLTDRLAELDGATAPSIVPAMHDGMMPAAAALAS